MKVGFLPIARTTFDIPYAEEQARIALDTLHHGPHTVVGDAALQTDDVAVTATARALADEEVDAIVVLQASFADSSLAVAASSIGVPLILWAFSEPRTGGRLRLNSFCGINLAAYTLTQFDRSFSWIHAQPEDVRINDQIGATPIAPAASAEPMTTTAEARSRAVEVVSRLRETTIGRIGERPDGFEPCGYEADALRATVGVSVAEVALPELFSRAASADGDAVALARGRSASFLDGMDTVDQDELERSLRINAGLRSLIEEGGWSGVATRCWPETFTEFGGAACTPMALLTEDGTPGAC
ncbi:MAG: L-fucose/L-arabinose isomerase family protein, partial [Acidimicrobiia bacterium]